MFLFVDSVQTCIDRVRERVRKGGHDVPESDIRRRYRRSYTNFWQLYGPLADRWTLHYNGSSMIIPVASGAFDEIGMIQDKMLLREFIVETDPSERSAAD
jgi:predicted ABC-type ATPase